MNISLRAVLPVGLDTVGVHLGVFKAEVLRPLALKELPLVGPTLVLLVELLEGRFQKFVLPVRVVYHMLVYKQLGVTVHLIEGLSDVQVLRHQLLPLLVQQVWVLYTNNISLPSSQSRERSIINAFFCTLTLNSCSLFC